MERFVSCLINQIKKSHLNFNHSAAILYKKKIMNYGINHFGGKGLCTGSIHAEQDAIFKYLSTMNCSISWDDKIGWKILGKIPKKKIELIVIRINNNEIIRNSYPCGECIKLMKKVGIKKVHYSTEDACIVSRKVSSLKKFYLTAGHMHVSNQFKKNPTTGKYDFCGYSK